MCSRRKRVRSWSKRVFYKCCVIKPNNFWEIWYWRRHIRL